MWGGPARRPRGRVGLLLGALALVAACSSGDSAGDPVDDTPICATIREIAELGARSNRAMAGEWSEASAALSANIAATDAAYRELIEAGDPEVAEAAADLLAFDEAIIASGALDAASADEFAATASGLPGSAEAGAADTVLKEYARDTCGFGDEASPDPEE